MNHAETIYAFFVSLSVDELSIRQLSALAEPFGITETNIRSILSRFHEKDLITVRKEGRTAVYRIGSRGARIGNNTAYHFRDPDWFEWDGRYWGAAFSDSDESVRYRLRKKLSTYRFRALYPGLWIRPLNPQENIPEIFQDMISGQRFDLFACSFRRELSQERIAEIFGLEQTAAVLLKALSGAEKSLEMAATLSPPEAFRERMLTGDMLVHALASDPLLPPSLLPDSWPAGRLRGVFRTWNHVLSERSEPFISMAIRTA